MLATFMFHSELIISTYCHTHMHFVGSRSCLCNHFNTAIHTDSQFHTIETGWKLALIIANALILVTQQLTHKSQYQT